jgi:hypothetical protein
MSGRAHRGAAGAWPSREPGLVPRGVAANGSEKRGSVRNSVSVSDSKKASRSSFSCAVRVKPWMNSLW